MRVLKRLQLFLRPQKVESSQSAELEEIAKILAGAEGIRAVYQQVLEDASGGKKATGAEGLTAEQIVGLGILRLRLGATYRELSELTGDSLSVRQFLNIAPGRQLSKSAIQSNLKRIKESTWRMLNECLKRAAHKDGIEDGKTVRGDTTTTETNIHFPTDASLLCDGIRVLTRVMNRLKAWTGAPVESSDHSRRAKRKLYRINNARSQERRHPHYLELIRVTRWTVSYAEKTLGVLQGHAPKTQEELLTIVSAEAQLRHYIPLVKRVIDQAYRRIIKEEQLLASEKIVSIFEPHTDIIVKGHRDVVFGHKVLLTTGQSSLVLNLSVLDGNPADSSLVSDILDQHTASYGEPPIDLALDGGFASTANRDIAKEQGVANITFSKNLGLPLDSLVSSEKKHKTLLRFRSGIEGCISFLKRVFGLTRILDRTEATFKAMLQCAACAYNLTLLARIRIQRATT
jgi:IS5 family transposase